MSDLLSIPRTRSLLLGLLMVVFATSCIDEEKYNDTPSDNFEALWRIIDEKYCFLDYKHINWDSIHSVYAAQIHPDMRPYKLFDVLCDMLAELKDGHVNLYSSHDIGRYWNWYEDYPTNFYEDLQRYYIGTDYLIAGGLKYKILLPDSIGYIYCGSFSSPIGNANINETLYYLRKCRGLILDMRSNSGGVLTYANRLTEHFITERYLSGFIQYKTGSGHNDFSSPEPIYIDPSEGIRWLRPTAVLTNRRCYSATNWFISCMRNLPQVILVGDHTGGGSGLPFSSELPNGWKVRFSASPMSDANGKQIEFGVPPHYEAAIRIPEDFEEHTDHIIDTAYALLRRTFNASPKAVTITEFNTDPLKKEDMLLQ